MTPQIFSLEKPNNVIFPKNFQQISTKNAILSGFKFIFKVLIHVFLKEHTKCFSNMIRKLLSDVSIQIPPRVQNQFFHLHWISQGLCHWNSQYTWFSKVSWVFRGTMVHGFSKDSFEFRSISFPRTLSYLIKLSSILFSQSVCLTQNVVLSSQGACIYYLIKFCPLLAPPPQKKMIT